jgi:phosphatidate phosphatase APP1
MFHKLINILTIFIIIFGLGTPGSPVFVTSDKMDTVFVTETNSKGAFVIEIAGEITDDETWQIDSGSRGVNIGANGEKTLFVDLREPESPTVTAIKFLQLSAGILREVK